MFFTKNAQVFTLVFELKIRFLSQKNPLLSASIFYVNKGLMNESQNITAWKTSNCIEFKENEEFCMK
ncbi:MAG: hypothetical protein A2Y10_08505 [Planctomycetes bacterium GWF2_41_51]|nr:MAG: hypothetical protein A2Y10_08505 [Planctomycetes bacterium GWF2_41_51]HBG27078.1 hypothetical protein [Phycisphaerales bacterium]